MNKTRPELRVSRRTVGAALLTALLLGACNPSAPPDTSVPVITSFTATPATLPAGGGSVTLAWQVSGATGLSIDQGVGAVQTSGVTASVPSTTTFTLTATNGNGSVTAATTVTVSAPTSTTLTVTPAATVALNAGDTSAFTVTARDAGGNVVPTPAGLTWASADPAVATVDAGGLVNAVASGVTTIRARAGALTSAPVPVVVRPGGTMVYSVRDDVSSSSTVRQAGVDGSQDVKLGNGWNPSLSPNRAYVTYQRDGTYPFGKGDSVYVQALASRTEQQLVSNSDYLLATAWTPDSGFVLYDQVCGIYRLRPDRTGGATVHAGDCYADAPNADALTGRIAFHRIDSGGLWVMNADGSGVTHVPNTAPGDAWATWSPDGQWLSFLRGDPQEIRQGVLYKIHPDGTALTRLTAFDLVANGNYVKPTRAWTPDSKFLVAAMQENERSTVQLVDAAGSGVTVPLPVPNAAQVDFVGNVIRTQP